MTTVMCVLGDYIRQRSHVVPEHGAQGRYSLGTNVNTLFQVSSLEFGHYMVQCPQALKWTSSPCVHTVFISSGAVHCFVVAAKLVFPSGV